MKILLLLLCCLQDVAAPLQDEEEQAGAVQAICGVLAQGDRLPPEFSEEAVEKLEGMPPTVLPHMLRMMQYMPAASHLQMEQSGLAILHRANEKAVACPESYLQKFVESSRQEPYARRIALKWLDVLKPGSRRQFLLDHVSDEAWRYGAIEESLLIATQPTSVVTEAEVQTKILRNAFDAVTDIEQATRLINELQTRGNGVQGTKRLGVVDGWMCQTELQSSLPVFARTKQDESKNVPQLTITSPEPGLVSHVTSRIAQSEFRFVMRTDLQSNSDRRVIVRISSDQIPHLHLNGEEIRLNDAPEDSAQQKLHRYSRMVTFLRGLNQMALKFEPPGPEDNPAECGTDVSFCLQLVDENGAGISAPEIISVPPKTP